MVRTIDRLVRRVFFRNTRISPVCRPERVTLTLLTRRLILAPREGLEPPTYWLTARRSTIELPRNLIFGAVSGT